MARGFSKVSFANSIAITNVKVFDGSQVGICTGEVYKNAVKLTFFKGASLEDPSHLFTQPGIVRRAIDIHEGDEIDEKAFRSLIRAAANLNTSKSQNKPH